MRTKIDVNYVGNKAVIVPLVVLVDCIYDQLLTMIYLGTCIDSPQW